MGVISCAVIMYCPLCLAEFRDGFTQCSDCHVSLVGSLQDTATNRVRLWKGDRQTKLDILLGKLDEAQIPFHYKEIINAIPRLSIMGIPIGPRRSTFEYEIWIFRGDLDRARAATRSEGPST
jgi:hypothetical protein